MPKNSFENQSVESGIGGLHQKRSQAEFESQTGQSWDEERHQSRKELRRKLHELRERVHAEIKVKLEERIRNNPHPTDEEIMIGAFWEEIEPQVRDAIKELHRKGYPTFSSGFWGQGDKQVIEGWFGTRFEEDEKTADCLHKLGTGYLSFPSVLEFEPDTDDLADIAKRWQEIVAVLPDRGTPLRGIFYRNVGSEEFRKKYADPKRVEDLERDGKETLRRLAEKCDEWDREAERPKRVRTIKELETKLALTKDRKIKKKLERDIKEQKSYLPKKSQTEHQ